MSPVLLYNREIWGCFLKSVGRNNYDKFVSRIPDERITLGRFPLHLIIYTRIFRYFLRLLTLQNNQILNSALEINIHLNNVGKHSWFTTVRHLLHFTKLNDYTPNLLHPDYRTFPHLVTRVSGTKMRISCHLLPTESGRYKKIPRVEKLCPHFNRSEVGDEFHYLLKCTQSSLSYIRGIFLESLYSINSNFTNMSRKALF